MSRLPLERQTPMRERSLLPLGVLVLLSASSLSFAPPLPQGVSGLATQAAANRTVDLKVEKMDVRQAIRTVFKAFPSQSFTISPEVQGAVSADFRGLVLDDALSVLLRQVDAAVMIEAGVYCIVSRAEPSRTVILDGRQAPPLVGPYDGRPTPLAVEPPVVTSDATFLYVVRQGVVYKIQKATMKVVGEADLNPRRIKIVY